MLRSGSRVIAAVMLVGLLTHPVAAQTEDHSANYFLPSCRDFVDGHYAKNPLLQGQCIGMIEALATFAADQPFQTSRSCPPEKATIRQLTTVVVRWIEQRPQRWHENFKVLVLLALHDAWPCSP
jgi:hypothetical protein